MATTPAAFGTGTFTRKSFWKKPEGIPGMALTAAMVGAGLWGLYLAIPFLTSIVWGMVSISIGLGILGLFAYVVTNGTVQTLAKNMFQSLCRGIATFYTTIDPIGILKNQLDDMKKAKARLDQTIQRFSGSDRKLQDNIARKKAEIKTLIAKANEARKMLATVAGTGQDAELKREQFSLSAQTYEQQAGLLMDGVDQFQGLEAQTSDMLGKFRHWSQVSDAKIQRTEMRVEFFSEQRSMILDAKQTLSLGQKLLKGDPEQLQLVDGAIEFLQEDTSRTLGEIEDFNRFSDKMLTDIDIENGANAEIARQRFAEFGTKLEADANRPSAVDQLQNAIGSALASPGFNASATPRPAAAGGNKPGGAPASRTPNANSGGDYNDMFK
jgi:hypothetical protein